MMRFAFQFTLLLAMAACGVNAQTAGTAPAAVTPGAPAVPKTDVPEFWRVPAMNSLVILNSSANFNPNGVTNVSRLVVRDDLPLLRLPEFQTVVSKYLWQPMTETSIKQLQRDIIFYYRAHNRPLVDVSYPEQDVSNGNLQVIVTEGRLRAVRVEDSKGNGFTNGWTKADELQQGISAKKGGPILESQLNGDLDWLNRNPFRKVNVLYEKGLEPGASDLVLRVEEQRPFKVFVGYEDSGSRITDEERILAGVIWGKAFGLTDHQLSYQFMGNPGFDLLRAHTATYVAPLPWRHLVRIFGSYVDVKGDLSNGNTLEGNSYQASLRYEIPLPFIEKYQHELSLGFDYKNNENNVLFNAQTLANQPTEVFQAAFGYTGALPDSWGQSGVGAQIYFSPGGITEKNSDAAYGSYFNAKSKYMYARFTAERATKLPITSDWESAKIIDCFSWNVRGLAQVSDANLLPSEQLGLGGYATARGYEEREANEDRGWLISNELRTPGFSLTRFFGKSQLNDRVQFLGFWDYGIGMPKHVQPGQEPHAKFNSVGPGVRYEISRYLALRFDYGWQLSSSGQDIDPTTKQRRQDSRGHLGVQISF